MLILNWNESELKRKDEKFSIMQQLPLLKQILPPTTPFEMLKIIIHLHLLTQGSSSFDGQRSEKSAFEEALARPGKQSSQSDCLKNVRNETRMYFSEQSSARN